ncbi:MAG: hypothetical protein V1659_00370, partial [Candidatus Woesearchaeota archaeon]
MDKREPDRIHREEQNYAVRTKNSLTSLGAELVADFGVCTESCIDVPRRLVQNAKNIGNSAREVWQESAVHAENSGEDSANATHTDSQSTKKQNLADHIYAAGLEFYRRRTAQREIKCPPALGDIIKFPSDFEGEPRYRQILKSTLHTLEKIPVIWASSYLGALPRRMTEPVLAYERAEPIEGEKVQREARFSAYASCCGSIFYVGVKIVGGTTAIALYDNNVSLWSAITLFGASSLVTLDVMNRLRMIKA